MTLSDLDLTLTQTCTQPGTGKTLLARAIACNIEASFLKVVSSAIVDKYIGESARLIREMFGYAKERQPCVIFMDEIDAIGGRRFSEGTSADREIQRTLMELLNQLDGFDVLNKVKIIMATNRPDVLDPALLRPGCRHSLAPPIIIACDVYCAYLAIRIARIIKVHICLLLSSRSGEREWEREEYTTNASNACSPPVLRQVGWTARWKSACQTSRGAWKCSRFTPRPLPSTVISTTRPSASSLTASMPQVLVCIHIY